MLVRDFTAFINLGPAEQLHSFKPSTAIPVSNLQFFRPSGRTGLLSIYLEKSSVQEKPSVDSRGIKKKVLDSITNS